MKREFLEKLGLEKETIDQVMAEHGKTVGTYKTKATDLQSSLDDLDKQLKQRDKDLKELEKKAEGSDDLQQKLTDLQTKYETEKTAYETKLKETRLGSAVKLALKGKVHDADLVAGLIDSGTIELDDDGKVKKGLDDQIKSLKESKSFLFVDENAKPNVAGTRPAEGDPGTPGDDQKGSFGERLAKEAAESNQGLEKARNSYFE